MLAYVFWHRPAPDADAAVYEAGMVRFHASLAQAPPPGFHGSVTFARAALPWFDGYEDWYLVEDWNAVGVLNDAAVSASHRAPHDAVATRAAAGTAAILRCDAPGDLSAVCAMRWADEPLAGDVVWRRQLVLGPAPQYCAHLAAPQPGAIAREPLR